MVARRNKPYISQFFRRDQSAFTALSKVGHLSKEHISGCGIVESRLKNYVRDGLVEKVCYKHGNRLDDCYKLTKAGRDIASHQWGMTNHYHAQSPKHDLEIAKKYFSLSEEVRSTWKTETELRERFIEDIFRTKGDEGNEAEKYGRYEQMIEKGLLSFPDGSFTNEHGVQVVFEVITNNYGISELLSKEAYVEIMKTEYETIRV